MSTTNSTAQTSYTKKVIDQSSDQVLEASELTNNHETLVMLPSSKQTLKVKFECC